MTYPGAAYMIGVVLIMKARLILIKMRCFLKDIGIDWFKDLSISVKSYFEQHNWQNCITLTEIVYIMVFSWPKCIPSQTFCSVRLLLLEKFVF